MSRVDLMGLIAGRSRLVVHIDSLDNGLFRGWAADLSNLDESMVLEMRIRGFDDVVVVDADVFRQDLVDAGIGNGRHGFICRIPSLTVADRFIVDAKLRDHRTKTGSDAPRMSPAARSATVRFGSDAARAMERLNRPRFVSKTSTIFIDVIDLFVYLRHHSRLSGIQRVIAGLITELASNAVIQFCFIDQQTSSLAIVDKQLLKDLISCALYEDSHLSLHNKIDTIQSRVALKLYDYGDIFVIVGGYWVIETISAHLINMKERGVLIGVFVHDLIPIVHPKWVTEEVHRAVHARAVEMLVLSDFFMTNSVFVRDELQALMQSELGLSKPCEVVLLPHETPATSAGRSTVAPSISEFVLCVGTIEGRKNHVLLFRVWAALIRRYGFDRVPDLVLVGRWGWNVDEFRALMEGSANLHGKIKLRVGLSDAELGDLYRSCLFTVFPSFVEGWGLPVGESLAAGAFCIASRTSSIPEVGETFADYFDPHDYFDALGKIERCLVDRTYLKDRTNHIASSFRRRSWRDFADAFLAAVRNAPNAQSGRDDILPELTPGRVYAVTGEHLTDPTLSWSDKRLKFTCSSGWGALEDWGSWSNVPSADVRFRCTEPAGTAITLLLALRLPDPYGDITIRTEGPGETPVTFKNGNQTWVSLDTIVGADGGVTITLERDAKDGRIEPHRALYIGYSGLAYFTTDNPNDKMTIACEIAGLETCL